MSTSVPALNAADFQRQVMRRKIWTKQEQILSAIQRNRSVSVKGCHGSGKTYAVAGLVPYELLVDRESVVLTVAPTLRQVKLMWSEIHGALNDTPARWPEGSTTSLQLSEKNYALGFSSSKGVNAQGFHGKRVLIIADEAIGISGDVWDAIEGIRAAGDVRLVKLCNPTVPSGPVFEDFTRLRAHTECITISAFDTPNFEGLTLESLLQLPEDQLDIAPFPWLTRRRWVKEMYYKWGPTNPRFMSRVLGEFPTQADDSVFALAWVEKAGQPFEAEDLTPYRNARLYIQVGIDIAGPGDDETVATARLGPYVVGMEAWPDADPLDKCLTFLSGLKVRFPGHPIVLVGDTVGIGYYFMRALARAKYDVRCFVAQAVPMDQVLYASAKAEGYFNLRECMRDGHVIGVTDEDTKAQLSDIRYRERGGRIEIEHKAEARSRGSRSPDRAESLVMSYVKLVPRQQTTVVNEAGSYQISPI